VDRPLATARRELPRSEVRLLIERAMMDATGADFAFMNAGGVRDSIPAGALLERHIWNVMPFDNLVVTAKVKGRDLPRVLAKGRAVEPDRRYTIATSDFTAANQGAPSHLGVTGLEFTKDGPLLRDVIIGHVRQRRTLE
jgi:2',3'-cyclic-nucleotide 2'-phosphodiesterase (5'-nucleotidase family)